MKRSIKFATLCKVCAYRKGYDTCCSGCRYCANRDDIIKICHCDGEVNEVEEEKGICYHFRYLAR